MTDSPVAPQMWEPAARVAGAAEQIAAPSLTYWQDVRQRLWRNRHHVPRHAPPIVRRNRRVRNNAQRP